jgi:hypothetical protein
MPLDEAQAASTLSCWAVIPLSDTAEWVDALCQTQWQCSQYWGSISPSIVDCMRWMLYCTLAFDKMQPPESWTMG